VVPVPIFSLIPGVKVNFINFLLQWASSNKTIWRSILISRVFHVILFYFTLCNLYLEVWPCGQELYVSGDTDSRSHRVRIPLFLYFSVALKIFIECF